MSNLKWFICIWMTLLVFLAAFIPLTALFGGAWAAGIAIPSIVLSLFGIAFYFIEVMDDDEGWQGKPFQ